MRELLTLLVCCLLLSCVIDTNAQNLPPKREFRGVWIASVGNIDYPSSSRLSVNDQKKEWIDLVDYYQNLGLNAIIAQIRPAADAFYPSKLAPWSSYLTGKQGRAPGKGFDPMQFMIEETHKRGMEFHAWLNPYRASVNLDTSKLSKMHPVHKHPEWFIGYGKRLYFDPGIPEVQDYLTEVIEEILMSYDVDAIHFDDYFYPYKIKGEDFNDSLSFEKYGFGYFYVEDWRRNNIDRMIELVSNKIKAVSPHVKFGISPFGVWRNGEMDPVNGSNTAAGVTNYDDLYADILKWLERGWIDYVAPQIYWHIGYFPANYEVLIDWWARHVFDRHLYIGHAAYKVGDDKQKEWYEPSQIPKQIQMARDTEMVKGSIYFRSKSIQNNPLGIKDSLEQNYYKYPALLPEMNFIKGIEPPSPVMDPIKWKKGACEITWRFQNDNNLPTYCVIYRFEEDKIGDFDDPKNIFRVIRGDFGKVWKYRDNSTENGKSYSYVITGVNRNHTESDLSNPRIIKRKKKKFKKIK